jgi:fumarate reductase flavoprotein subunit
MAAAPNITFVDDAPVADLLIADGRVTGVRLDRAGAVEEIGAADVVLASDGFGNDRELVERYCPTAADAFYGGVSTSNGDAVRWGARLGAALRNMSAYLGHGMVAVGHGTRLNPNLPFLGALLVEESGNRFCEETAQGYSKLGGIIRGLPTGRAALIWDEPAHRLAANSELMRESTAAGAFRRFDSVAELAGRMGLPPDSLAATVAGFPARSALVDRPDERLHPPFYASWITHGMLTTQGGLAVDTKGRVLRADGGRVDGLSAGGGAAAGLSGSSPDGYSSGNGLLAALGLGWIIGDRLAGADR